MKISESVPIITISIVDLPDSTRIMNTLDQMKQELHPGDQCSRCQTGIIDYDNCLNLVCMCCGFTLAGGCT